MTVAAGRRDNKAAVPAHVHSRQHADTIPHRAARMREVQVKPPRPSADRGSNWQRAAAPLREDSCRIGVLVGVEIHDDEGAAYRLLAQACERLDRIDDARDAYRRGVDAAERFGHISMVEEFQDRIDELDR